MKILKRNWVLVIILVVLGLKYGTAQEQSFKVRRWSQNGGLFHGMGTADLTIDDDTITFTNGLAPELNREFTIDPSLVYTHKDTNSWTLQSPVSKDYTGMRITFTNLKGNKAHLTIEYKDTFTGDIHSYAFLLIKNN